MKQYEVVFYENEQGFCQVADWIRDLNRINSKDNKSMLKKVYYQIERLENEGLKVGEPIIKRLDNKIWEMRPIPNRIFFGVLEGNQIVLLHQFRKKSMKTPKHEIEKARREYISWLKRGEQS